MTDSHSLGIAGSEMSSLIVSPISLACAIVRVTTKMPIGSEEPLFSLIVSAE
jgi:hypothetical protein